ISAGVAAFNANYRAQLASASPAGSIDSRSNTIAVTASSSVPTTLLNVIGLHSIAVSATSVARMGGSQTDCVLALQTTNDAIFVHGSGGLRANCGIQSNSTGSNGIDFDGDSVTSASSICVVGSYLKDSQAQVSPAPKVKCPSMADPL